MALQVAAYTLGKLHSKYLILDILAFAGDRLSSKILLSTSSHNLRSLLIKNYQLFNDSVEDQQLLELTSFSQLLYPQLLLNKRLSVVDDYDHEILRGLLQIQSILGNKQELDLHSLTYDINEEEDK